MTDKRQQMIADLADDLQPTKPVGSAGPAALWLVFGLIFAAGLAWMDGPFRDNAFQQLLLSAQFFVESALGLVSVALLIFSAFELSIPSTHSFMRRLVMPLAALAAWVGFYLWGLYAPALEPSMAGKRHFCYLQTLLYSVPLLLAGLFWARRQYPIHGARIGLLLGLAAGSIPALVMQFACVYIPAHILQHHILPGLSIGVLGALAGALWLKPKK